MKEALQTRLNAIFFVSNLSCPPGHSGLNIPQSVYTRRSEVDTNGSSRKSAIRPKAKRYTSETLPDRDLFILSLLTLWRTDIWWYHDCLQPGEIDGVFAACVTVYSAPADPAVKWSLGRTFRYLIESVVQFPRDSPRYPLLVKWVEEVGYVQVSPCGMLHIDFGCSPAILASVANHLLNLGTDLPSQRMFIQQLYEIMYCYANPESVSWLDVP